MWVMCMIYIDRCSGLITFLLLISIFLCWIFYFPCSLFIFIIYYYSVLLLKKYCQSGCLYLCFLCWKVTGTGTPTTKGCNRHYTRECCPCFLHIYEMFLWPLNAHWEKVHREKLKKVFCSVECLQIAHAKIYRTDTSFSCEAKLFIYLP